MRKIRDWWRGLNYSAKLRLLVIPALFAGGLASSLLGIARTGDSEGFWLNLGTELLGAFVTFILLDLVIGHGERLEAEVRNKEELKERLLRELRNPERPIALRALEELRAFGWLEDGTLEWANLSNANLEGAKLLGVEFPRARLNGANLQQANLQIANLQEADLSSAVLKGANLSDASLIEADLSEADMRAVNLAYANLKGACLQQANLEDSSLQEANLYTADLRQCNLRSVQGLQTIQLAQAHYLWRATLPNGDQYDGRFKLKGDVELARREGFDIFNEQDMTKFYGIALETYRGGQQWAREHLNELTQYIVGGIDERDRGARILVEGVDDWSITRDTEHNVWIVSAKREVRIDSSTAINFDKVLSTALEQRGCWIVFNLRHAQFISSAGLRVMISAKKRAKNSGKDIVLCAVSSRIYEVLDLVGFLPLFDIYNTLDETIEAIASMEVSARKGQPSQPRC